MNYEDLNLTPCRPVPSSEKKLAHLEDAVGDKQLSADAKRALLAGWASDANAVPGAPTLRQLDNGDIVTLATILNALEEIDDLDAAKQRLPQEDIALGSVASKSSANGVSVPRCGDVAMTMTTIRRRRRQRCVCGVERAWI